MSFGLVEIDGRRFDRDVVVEAGHVRRRKKKPSKAYRDRYGHTPLSPDEKIPWSASRLIVGTGASSQLRSCQSCITRPSDEASRSLPCRPKRPAACCRGLAGARPWRSFA